MLQKYRIKYSSRHQFLGDFFENLLNTGIKQEAGQFFTPIPLVRFILKSLPIEDIIEKKISTKDPYILPYIIDYACGAGHFLTESIEEINSHFDVVNPSKLSGQQLRFFTGTKNNYLWAKDYIYGIEKDHRLAKTTKIAMFLNGDGDASILSGDGLDDFYYSTKYLNLLKSNNPSQSIRNFDIVVSNPPFSVDGFINTVKNSNINFSSSKYVSNKSSEIECFFIERTLQLLKDGGVCGLILPISILNNDRSIYIHARKLLLLFTEIISLVELREKTFVATNTTSCIVLFRKRNYNEIANAVKNMLFKESNENEKLNIKEFQKSILEEYQEGKISSKTLENKNIYGLISELLKNKRIVIAFSGEKKRQEFFLGYRYSKSKRKEGISWLKRSLLFNYAGASTDTLDVLIKNAFNGKFLQQPSGELEKHAKIVDFIDMINEKEVLHISTPSSLIANKTIQIESISPIGDIIDEFENEEIIMDDLIQDGKLAIFPGLTYDKDEDEVPEETNIRVLTASNIDLSTGKLKFGNKMIHLRNDFPIHNYGDISIQKNDIIMSMSSGSLKHLGKVAYAEKDYEDLLIGGFLHIIRTTDEKLSKALYYRFMSKSFREFVFTKKGQNINNLKMNEITSIRIRIPKDLESFEKKLMK